jgi:ribonuclease P protein component
MERLRQRSDFLAAARGFKVAAATLVLQAIKRDDSGSTRVGFTVSKKVGNAVERNRVRRRLKDIVRRSPPDHMLEGHDYVLVGRRAALTEPFARMMEEFQGALRRLHRSRPATTSRTTTQARQPNGNARGDTSH